MASSSNHKILRRCTQISSFPPPDWSILPPDLLQSIASALQSLADYIRFRSVCRSWKAAVEIDRCFLPRELPWLMLPFTSSSDEQHRAFFNPFTNTHYRLFLPEVSPKRGIVGSSPSGIWVVTDEYPKLMAINPLTREKFPPPPFPTVDILNGWLPRRYTKKYVRIRKGYYNLDEMYDFFFKHVILTRDSQDPSKFLAFATPPHLLTDLAYCKQGDMLWRNVRGTREYCEAAIWFRGKLYLVDEFGSLAICEFSHHQDDSPPVVEFIKCELGKVVRRYVMVYLVDAMDELLMVRKYEQIEGKELVKFDVFKFDWSAKEWRSMASLENRILFLSPQPHYSFAVSSDSYPGWGKESIVWFKSDYLGFEALIFKMSGGLIKDVAPFYNGKILDPIWFAPNLR